MSETVTYRGKLKKFERLDGESNPDYVKRFIDFKGEKIPDYFEQIDEDNYSEVFCDLFYKDGSAFVKGTIYEGIEKKRMDEHDIFESSENPDGTISFLVQYYNGGCGFYDAIEEALENKARKV